MTLANLFNITIVFLWSMLGRGHREGGHLGLAKKPKRHFLELLEIPSLRLLE